MEYIQVLKRAWHIVWRYRALWIWGIILALTTTSWSAWTLADLYDKEEGERTGLTVTRLDGETFGQALRRTLRAEIDQANRELNAFTSQVLHVNVRLGIGVLVAVLAVLAVLVYIVGRIARYVSETTLIRLVGVYEQTSERHNVWQGLRIGWSRSAWRLFLIDLLVGVLGVLSVTLLFALILAPLPLWVEGGEAVIFLMAFTTAGLLILGIAVVILGVGALSLLVHLSRRACALGELGVLASLRQGYAVARHHLREAGLVWLIAAGVRWAWRLALVPVALALAGVGLLVGSLPALLVGGVTSLITTGELPVFLALAVGIPIFITVLGAPLVLLAGLREAFLSTTWTLAYRQLRSLEAPVPQRSPSVEPSGLGVAPVVS
jgi:hypothetical protein